jgi:hypothetical protein
LLLAIGFPRSHLLTALLGILALFYYVPKNTLTLLSLIAISVASMFSLHPDRINSEKEVWAASGFYIASHYVDCLSIQKKGIFSVPYQYYEARGELPPLTNDCDYFLMTTDPTLKIPANLRLHSETLSTYGVELYRYDDLKKLVPCPPNC